MPDKKDKPENAEFPSFKQLNEFERRAVIMRSEGKQYQVIANHINANYGMHYSERTVREWFNAGGRLEQAHSEYNEAQAVINLKEARQLIRKAQKVAAINMISKINSSDETISLRASQLLLNKYIPDKQLVLDAPEAETDLPEELIDAANAVKESENSGENTGGDDGPAELDEPPVGEANPATPGE